MITSGFVLYLNYFFKFEPTHCIPQGTAFMRETRSLLAKLEVL